jgi:hypothetical protein
MMVKTGAAEMRAGSVRSGRAALLATRKASARRTSAESTKTYRTAMIA